MVHWVDPDETDPQHWRGRSEVERLRSEDQRSVLERAEQTGAPYQYEDDVHHTDVGDQFRSREYTDARVIYNCGVDAQRRVKLLTRGVFWGGSDPNQRFKAQYRREPPPTETVPFDSYSVWIRFQYGAIERVDDGVRFVADDTDPRETVRTLAWSDLYEPVRARLAELELVRNPALARYRLEELDEWAEYRTLFAFDPAAFAVGP